MIVKKIPMRTCIGCKVCKPKKELFRVIKTKEGTFSLDITGKANGRGAYVCGSKACVEKIIKKKLLNVVFETQVPDELYEELRENFVGKK